jgi:hypothetical protein
MELRMLPVLLTVTPGRREEYIQCQKANVRIAVHPIILVKTLWNSTLQLLKRSYCSRVFTREWRAKQKYTDYWLRFTTQDEWTIVKYVMDVLMPFRYWNLWMSKRHSVI